MEYDSILKSVIVTDSRSKDTIPLIMRYLLLTEYKYTLLSYKNSWGKSGWRRYEFWSIPVWYLVPIFLWFFSSWLKWSSWVIDLQKRPKDNEPIELQTTRCVYLLLRSVNSLQIKHMHNLSWICHKLARDGPYLSRDRDCTK